MDKEKKREYNQRYYKKYRDQILKKQKDKNAKLYEEFKEFRAYKKKLKEKKIA